MSPADVEVTGATATPRVLSWDARSRPAGVTADGIRLTDVDVGDGYACCVAVLTHAAVEVRLCRI